MATASQLTLTQLRALPETKPASEYVDGEVLQKLMPTGDHGEVQRLISFILTLYVRAHAGGRAGSEIRCIFGPAGAERADVPDYIFVRAGRRASAQILVEDDTLDDGDVLPGLSCVVRDILPTVQPVLPEDAP